MVWTVPSIRRNYFGFKGYPELPITYPRTYIFIHIFVYFTIYKWIIIRERVWDSIGLL